MTPFAENGVVLPSRVDVSYQRQAVREGALPLGRTTENGKRAEIRCLPSIFYQIRDWWKPVVRLTGGKAEGYTRCTNKGRRRGGPPFLFIRCWAAGVGRWKKPTYPCPACDTRKLTATVFTPDAQRLFGGRGLDGDIGI